MRFLSLFLLPAFLFSSFGLSAKTKVQQIDREALVKRHELHIQRFDSLSSVSVGNGNFAFTVDATGLQSFPEVYKNGVPLGTQSQWGWHSYPNVNQYTIEETYKSYNFRGKEELYATQVNEPIRSKEAADYFRMNPHRLHLGIVGLEIRSLRGEILKASDLMEPQQSLDLWNGIITSSFRANEQMVRVETVCSPQFDRISSCIESPLLSSGQISVKINFPYPTGQHTDDGCDWSQPQKHKTVILDQKEHSVLLERILDADTYYVLVSWKGSAAFIKKADHTYRLTTGEKALSFSCEFLSKKPGIKSLTSDSFLADKSASGIYWNNFWKRGAAVDFSLCKDSRAMELERRVVLSQYLMAIQCAGIYPPQESGLTYNTWFGKFHLEMHWWHGVQFALWNRPELLERSLGWYRTAEPIAADIAKRQGFKGVRWMKMTDPSAKEAPSKVGSFLIWQQPHLIYLSELMYRSHPNVATLEKYKDLVFKTADFMADFVDFDTLNNRFVLKGAIPAQETLKASETVNPPYELQYWFFSLNIAQQWRMRLGMKRNADWDNILAKLSPLASKDGLYLAAETALDTYTDIRFTSDHMAVLGALGILPDSRLVQKDIMTNTFNWIWDNWNWDETWGWDYPMTAMCAARLGMAEKAVSALLMDKRTNTYLVNGHNYQDERLRVYLPGNGGLLTAVAMMCAGWDGSQGDTPGFPKDGNWKVRWEGLKRMP